MANKLDELIDQIPESRLRLEIAAEVRKLKEQKKFGLVFEEHLPETVRLSNHPIRPGELVALKAERGNDLWLVKSVNSRSAHCIRPQVKYPAEERDFSLKELVAVKRFGEPIYPVLVPVDRVARGGTDKPWHTLINGDNFHALQLLLYCYEGQVDVIYIDPPYNTGARDWRYNNDYVDSADSWRHSKWLSMMKRRLLLAKRLLRHDGVLICTIDEWEIYHLGMLLKELFPNHDYTNVVIVHNDRGTKSNNFAFVHEYAIFMTPANTSIIGKRRLSPEEQGEWKLRMWGANSRRQDRRGMFHPIYVEDGRVVGIGDKPSDDFHPRYAWKQEGNRLVFWPLDGQGVERRWRWKKSRILDESDRLTVKEINGRQELFIRGEEEYFKTTWHDSRYDANTHGSRLVKTILGSTEFPFPKSLYAVQDCIHTVCANRPNAVIVDFFGGSGTTLHATCLLNSEDNGKRRCILVTNNEVDERLGSRLHKTGHYSGDVEFEKHGICEAVTWPRCKYVINGKRDDDTELSGTYLSGRELKEGFEENLEYFRLDFVDPSAVAMGEAFEAILPLLWMKAGCRGEQETSRGSRPWFMPKNSPYAVLIKEKHFAEFRKELAGRNDVRHVFLVTDAEENFRTMSRALGAKYEAVQLYKSYLENFRINTTMPTSL